MENKTISQRCKENKHTPRYFCFPCILFKDETTDDENDIDLTVSVVTLLWSRSSSRRWSVGFRLVCVRCDVASSICWMQLIRMQQRSLPKQTRRTGLVVNMTASLSLSINPPSSSSLCAHLYAESRWKRKLSCDSITADDLEPVQN